MVLLSLWDVSHVPHGCCRFMASEPDKWDYALAGVPSPLTDEMESQQMAKQVDRLHVHIAHA